ncbi:MAG: hypothetical protein WCC64_15260 [Aliidongia sp.]
MKRIGRVILVEKAVPPILTQAHRDPKAARLPAWATPGDCISRANRCTLPIIEDLSGISLKVEIMKLDRRSVVTGFAAASICPILPLYRWFVQLG